MYCATASPLSASLRHASDPRFAGSTAEFINDTPLYTNGLQAFEEYNPIREETYGDTGDPVTSGEAKLYRFNIHGSDAATFVLDARSFRDENLTPPNPLDPADVARYIGETFDPTRTLLGTAQLDQLMQDLLTAQKSGTTWKFIFVPEPIQNFGPVESEDRYEGFAAERNQLLKFIADHGISNVVFVAADVHAGIVNNLTYQEFPGGPQIPTTAIEITTGPVAHEPFGFDIVDLAARLGVITPEQKAFYESLPVAPDPDDVVNDKDDFVKSLVNGQLAQFGYDPIGLDNNLPQADGLVNAQLLQGDYFIAHQFCWTKFSIDPATQKLTVTTYGIPSYSAAEAQADPAAIAALQPTAVAEFTVTPVLAEAGNKTFIVNSGDQIDIPNFGALGVRDHPSAAVLAELDTLQFIGPGLVARNMLLAQHGDDVMITFAGDSSGTRVTLQNTQVGELDNVTIRGKAVGNFIFDGQTTVVDDLDVFGSKGAPAIVRGHDRVTFLNDFDNHFHGRAGSQDVINAQGGDDTVFGAGGADLIRGGTGSDSLSGDAGNDTLAGDSGNDAVLSAGSKAVLGSDIDRVDGGRRRRFRGVRFPAGKPTDAAYPGGSR